LVLLLQNLNDFAGLRIDQHGLAIDHGVAIGVLKADTGRERIKPSARRQGFTNHHLLRDPNRGSALGDHILANPGRFGRRKRSADSRSSDSADDGSNWTADDCSCNCASRST